MFIDVVRLYNMLIVKRSMFSGLRAEAEGKAKICRNAVYREQPSSQIKIAKFFYKVRTPQTHKTQMR